MTELKKELTKFELLCELNCNDYTEKKNGLTYLSWTYAWKEFKKFYPDAKYEIRHWDGKPYIFDENLGYMCETEITAGGETHTMWLPVMDGSNKAQKHFEYQIKTKNGSITVKPATMFDINTTIMRCLVKNIAMFGLGLYIYSGEDIPELSETTIENNKAEEIAKKIVAIKERIKALLNSIDPTVDTSMFANYETINDVETLTNIGIALKKLSEKRGA